jgi:hypothetical protein
MVKKEQISTIRRVEKSLDAKKSKFIQDCNEDPDMEGFEGSKRYFLYAIKLCKGNISNAAKMIKMCRRTHYKYCYEDSLYLERSEDITEFVIDHVEDKLMNKINTGDTTAMIFWLKCKGKKRGWIEKSEIDHTTKGDSLNKVLNNMTDEELEQKLKSLNEKMK